MGDAPPGGDGLEDRNAVREFLRDLEDHERFGDEAAAEFWPPALLFGFVGAVGALLVSDHRQWFTWWVVMLALAPLLLGLTYRWVVWKHARHSASSLKVAMATAVWGLVGLALILGAARWTPHLQMALPWLTLTPTWCWLGWYYHSGRAVVVGVGVSCMVLIASFSSNPGLFAHVGNALLLLTAFVVFYRRRDGRG